MTSRAPIQNPNGSSSAPDALGGPTDRSDSSPAGTAAARADRGRRAASPSQIPLSGWRDVIWRVLTDIRTHNITLIAAGVAFFAMLALVPGLIAIVSLYGLLAHPAAVAVQIEALSEALPAAARSVLHDQLHSIVTSSNARLSLGLLASVLVALVSASNGVHVLVQGVNVAYKEKETRGFLRLRARSFLFTVTAILFVTVALGTITLLPPILNQLQMPVSTRRLIQTGRWAMLGCAVIAGLAVLYRLAPNRTPPQWRWVSWGAVIATVVWLLASLAFSWVATNLGAYNQMYGALGGVVLLLLWFYISSFAILIGAEINAELEHQTAHDSTVGPPRPSGERGAVVADGVGPTVAEIRKEKDARRR